MDRLTNLLSHSRRWAALMAGVLVLGSVWIWASAAAASDTTGGRVPSPRAGFLAPDFTLELLSGGEVTLSELRGQAVIVNLWASWCPPCRAEMPALQEAYTANASRGLVVLAVNTTYQDSLNAASAFVAEHGLTFPIALDRTGMAANRYLLRALPTTFFIDREGVIQQVVVGGPMNAATIRAGVEMILQATR